MAYDEGLMERLREHTPTHLEEKRMFGGFGFFVNGNYAYGASKELVVRVGKENYEAALSQPHIRQMDLTGRPMRGWVFVGHDAIESDDDLTCWIQQGIDFASTLPPK